MATLIVRASVPAGVSQDEMRAALGAAPLLPPLVRLHDWQVRLEALMLERLAASFAWGSHDCALFAADAVRAITGVDLAADWRGSYTDARGAFRILEPLGGLRGVATAALREPVPVLMARAGDVGLVTQDDRDMLAVCGGTHWHVPGEAGLVALPLHMGVCAWRVG